MALHNIGVNLELTGEKEYAQALRTINAEQKELRSELDLSAASHKENANSLEALQEKYDILTKQIESQKDKVEVYETALENAKKKQEDAAESVNKYSDELITLREDMEKMTASGEASDEMLEEQQKKIDEAESALKRAQSAYMETSRSVDNWQTGLNVANAKLIELDGQLEATNKYLDEAKNSTDGCAKSIDEYGKEVGEATEQTSNFGEIMQGTLASGVIIAGLAALVDITKEAGKELYNLASSAAFWADEVNTLSTQTGVATDTIQALKYSEELLDVSLETVTGAMARNIRSMNSAREGSEKYADAYDKLGVKVTNANGELRNSEDVFWDVIDALGKVQNATEKDAIAMQLFGRNAQSLNTLIKAGSKGFQEMYNEADKLGYIMDTNTLQNLNRTSDAIERVSKTADAVKNQIGAEVAPVVESAAEDLQRLMEENADEVAEIVSEVIPALVDGLSFVVENLDTIIPVVEGVATAFITFNAATQATKLLNAAIALLPPNLSAAAVEQAALNAVQAISPMGAVAAAAGLLVTGLGMLISKTGEYTPKVYELTEEEQRLVDSMQAVNDQVNNHKTAFSDNVAAMAANRTQAQELVAKLRELQPAASGDAEKMRELEATVGQLNTLMPDLGLYVDNVTGEMNMSIDSVERYTDALMHQIEVEAYSDRIAELLREQVDIKSELIEKEEAYNAAIEANNAAYAERDRAEQAYRQALQDLENDIEGSSTMVVDSLREQSEAALQACEDTVMGNRQVVDEYHILQNNLEDVTDQYNEYMDLLADTAPQDAATAANDAMSTSFVNWRGYAVEATGDVEEKLNELEGAYIDAFGAAKESLESQMGLFQEFKVESQSIDTMTSNMRSQTEAMTQYGDNLQKALDLDIDPSIIASIEEMGMSGAGYLQALVDAAEEGGDSLTEFCQAWQENQQAFNELSASMAEFEVGFNETMGLIVEDGTASHEQMTEDQNTFGEEYVQSWTTMGEDSAQAVADAEPIIAENVTLVASSAISALNTEFGIGEDGRSTKGVDAGKAFGQGIADGIKAMEDDIVAAVAKVGQAAVDEAKEWARKIDEALGEEL